MSCDKYKDLMMGYLDDELTDEQRKEFEEHIAAHPECQAELHSSPLDETPRLLDLDPSLPESTDESARLLFVVSARSSRHGRSVSMSTSRHSS